MKPESLVRILAGSFVLAGVALTLLVSRWWLLLPAFVGANLLQSGFTGFCPPTFILTRLGWIGQDGIIHWGGQSGPADGGRR
jgi:hypothetical protein